jgi:hypothetical protein
MIERVPVLVVRLDRRDVVALPLRLGARRAALFSRREPVPERRGVGGTDERVRTSAHRDAPVRHRAARIRLGDFAERVEVLRIHEVVQQSDRVVELLLGRGAAADREVDRAEMLGVALPEQRAG